MNHLDHYDTSLGFETHPFYDPVGRRSAPAYSLSGRPREPYASIDERPEYVLERGPHGKFSDFLWWFKYHLIFKIRL